MLTAQARRVLATRQVALEVNDLALVRECEDYLARLGVGPDDYDPGPVTADPVPMQKRTTRTRVRTLDVEV